MANSQAGNANSFGQDSDRQVVAGGAEVFPRRSWIRRRPVLVQRRSEQQVNLEKEKRPDSELLAAASRLQRSCPL
jgi:hypothetical protein